jgi:peptidoglycan/LPS O-acetylase OafA/YrhL
MEIGVAVFFLISGFLLYRPLACSHLGEQPGAAVRLYLKRRLLRIVPAYWVALFFAAYVLHTVAPIHGVRGMVTYFGCYRSTPVTTSSAGSARHGNSVSS